jgi:glucose-1-phosphate thymidylyltransferase
MKGIILAGGKSTRLYPLTRVFSKHFLPIFDKPMIYYPLSVLMLAGIREILIISNPSEEVMFKTLLGDGKHLGLNIQFEIQLSPRGIADAFIIGEDFIGRDNVCLILGDNVFYGQDLTRTLQLASSLKDNAVILAYHVSNPSEFGVVEFDDDLNVISIEEKPKNPKSNTAVPGLYFYPPSVVGIAKLVKPSDRGEIEITSVNKWYMDNNMLKVVPLGRGMAWLDTGNPEALISASNFVETVQKRQGFYIGCIEEIAWRRNFISLDSLNQLAKEMSNTEYGRYLLDLGTKFK